MRRCIEPFARCWCQHHNLTSALRKTCNQAARRGYVLSAWFRVTEQTRFADFNAIKAALPAADYVAPFTIFDIGGNNFRLVTDPDARKIPHGRERAPLSRWPTFCEAGSRVAPRAAVRLVTQLSARTTLGGIESDAPCLP